jgi:hypothetical protein
MIGESCDGPGILVSKSVIVWCVIGWIRLGTRLKMEA